MQTVARIVPPTPSNLAAAARLIREGQVVGMPTETVYGLAGDALNEDALSKIFSVKERPTFDPLIVHVPDSVTSLDGLAELGLVNLAPFSNDARAMVDKLIARFWPGPLTLVLPKSAKVPDLATSGLQTVAVRMPAHPVAQALIKECGTPLAAPSANRFGRISPTSAEDVGTELGDRIPLILDGGRSKIGVESTVLHVAADGKLTVLRPGGAALEDIAAAVGFTPDLAQKNAPVGTGATSPGMLESHYAPRKKLILLSKRAADLGPDDISKLKAHAVGARHIGVLILSGDEEAISTALMLVAGITVTVQTLSRTGDLHEAAHQLFSKLRALDGSEASLLFAEQINDPRGLGYAIADRLKRASSGQI